MLRVRKNRLRAYGKWRFLIDKIILLSLVICKPIEKSRVGCKSIVVEHPFNQRND